LGFGPCGDAVEILPQGREPNADDPQLLRDRGRGYILIRKFDIAQRDLRKSAEKAPEGTCALAVAQYLAGASPHAQASYAHCQDPGVFGYLSARRAGASDERPPVARPPTGPAEIRMPGSTAPKEGTTRALLA